MIDNIIYLISCSKSKLKTEATARNLYTSPLFRKSVRFVEEVCFGNWMVLSAKHGLVSPSTLLHPYDETLNGAKKDTVVLWSNIVCNQILDLRPSGVVFLCGKLYYQNIVPCLDRNGIPCDVLMSGMGIGERLSFLTKQLNNKEF